MLRAVCDRRSRGGLHCLRKRANIRGKRSHKRIRDGNQEHRPAGHRLCGFRGAVRDLRNCPSRLSDGGEYADAAAERGGARHSRARHGDRRDRSRHRHIADCGAGCAAGTGAADGAGRPLASNLAGRRLRIDRSVRPRQRMADRLCRGALAVHDTGLRIVSRRPRTGRLVQARRRAMEPGARRIRTSRTGQSARHPDAGRDVCTRLHRGCLPAAADPARRLYLCNRRQSQRRARHRHSDPSHHRAAICHGGADRHAPPA